jgi:glycosyltransferase involved in cell wall biosynthesis
MACNDNKKNRFIIIIPFFNAREYIRECIDSVLAQSYTNWLAVCTDDHSEDDSSNLIPDDPRIIKRYNNQHTRQLANTYNAIINCGIDYDDDDVICILDGDDRLLGPSSLEIVAEIYDRKPNCLVTYGQFIRSSGKRGHCKPYTQHEFYMLRQKSYRASHLRTFKWKLYKEFLRQDPGVLSYRDLNGSFFPMAADVALMFPLLEIAGYPNVIFNEIPIYWYRDMGGDGRAEDRSLQRMADKEIRRKLPFKLVFLPLHYRLYHNGLTLMRHIYRRFKLILFGPPE